MTRLGVWVVAFAVCLGGASVAPAATLTVTNANDNGAGSLRNAIAVALSGDTIVFDAALGGATIAQASGDLIIDKNLTITGPAGGITLDRNGAGRVFRVFSNVTSATISGLALTNGYTTAGAGGVWNEGTLTLQGCTLTNHVNPNFGGAALYNTGTLTLIDCTIARNRGNNGGGIGNYLNATLTLIRTTVSNNIATAAPLGGGTGGGIRNDGALFLMNSTISGNTATDGGGGIGQFDGSLTAINSTIAFNSAPVSGGIGNTCSTHCSFVNMKSTIVANNAGGNCGGGGPVVVSFGHNLSSDGTCFSGGSDLNNTDPNLAPLANYGGPTETHALCSGPGAPHPNCVAQSIAIDWVPDPADCTDINGNHIDTDQRNVPRPRPAGGSCDIGAFELTDECNPDLTPPILECAPGVTHPADDACCADAGTATATDNCDPNPVVTQDQYLICGVGFHFVHYTATDASLNSSTCVGDSDIMDFTPPVLSCPPDQTLIGDVDCQAAVPAATAVDNCDTNLAVIASQTVLNGAGTYAVTYTTTDASNNVAQCTTSYTVVCQSCDCLAWHQVDTTGPSSRFFHAMTYDHRSSRRKVVLFGGFNSSTGFLSDTWERSNGTWTQVVASGPSTRTQMSLAYDDAREKSVLYAGGTGGPVLSDTWEWDGASWMGPLATGPGPRYEYAMAYDSARGVVVLFGGYSTTSGNRMGDTWEWNANGTWTRVATTGPTPRGSVAMAYDSARSKMILFGGNDGALRGDTWGWNGATATWALLAPEGPQAPPAREMHAMASFSRCGMVVLFGGRVAVNTNLGDTWVWTGAWTQVPGPAPSPRQEMALAYDSDRTKVVLFGGRAPVSLGDTWEFGTCDNPAGTVERLFLALQGNGDILLSWTPSCEPSDNDYEIYQGTSPTYTGHQPIFCTTLGLTYKMVTPPPNEPYLYYLIVPKNPLSGADAREGSYGRSSNLSQRPQGIPACIPQDIGCSP